MCGISSCGKTCKECMSLADKWVNTGGSSWKLEKLNGDIALTMDSVLLCRRGGIIVPETSGQDDAREIDWKQLMVRYPMLGFTAAVGKMGCSVFGFDPVNLNTGNYLYTPLLKGTGLIKQEPGGYHYAAGEGMEYTFDETGRLLTRKDQNGNIDHFARWKSTGWIWQSHTTICWNSVGVITGRPSTGT